VHLIAIGLDARLLLEHVGDRLYRQIADLGGVHTSDGGPLPRIHQSPLGGHLDRLLFLDDDVLEGEAERGVLAGHDGDAGLDSRRIA
jgi:hypothetical protein